MSDIEPGINAPKAFDPDAARRLEAERIERMKRLEVENKELRAKVEWLQKGGGK